MMREMFGLAPDDPRGAHGPIYALLLTIVGGGVALGLCLVALVPGLVVLGASATYDEARIGPLRTLAQRSTVYDSQGNTLALLGRENREEVKLSEVPELLQNAVIAVEDKTFWHNDGIDLNAVLRAGIKDLTSGEIEQGGSTITQQLVKKRLLSDTRSLKRKIREVVLALRLNEQYSKKQILEQYLNTVYFGQGAYGVKSAAERFFLTTDPGSVLPRAKSLGELTIGEAALLAGLISNPEGDNPFQNPRGATERRSIALRRMVEQGYITQQQADAASQEPLPTIKPEAELRPRTSWVEEVQDRLINDPLYAALGPTPAARRDQVLTGGLKITATLDGRLQQDAQDAINAVLPEKPGFTAALVAMEPGTGKVRAMVAGPGFEQSQYNIATSSPGRQAGSTWKTMTLAAALESGFSPNDSVDGTSPCDFGRLGHTANAEPGEGRMALRQATEGSVNCAFARTEVAVGFPKVIDTAHKMGITQKTLQPILTLTLGTIETTPLEMATVTSTVANGGTHHPPIFIDKITNPKGRVLFDANTVPGDRAISSDTSACEIDMLKGVIARGTGTAAQLAGGRIAFGKTGTTDLKADANFLGATPQLAAFVWHGNKDARVPGAGFGGQIPARIWKAFMDRAMAGQPNLDFPPAGLVCLRPGGTITELGRLDTPPPPPAAAAPAPGAPAAPAPAPIAPGPGRGKGHGRR